MTLKDLQSVIHIKDLNDYDTKELQSILNQLGYSLTIDGLYGPKTLAAFNKFKIDQKLTDPDLIGTTTVDLLLKLYEQSTNKPHNVTTINWKDFNSPVSKWFTVGEVFNNQQQRYTSDPNIQNKIVILAKELDKIRDDWGSAIRVTSWYRPPFVNRKVGGASNSQHLYGWGVDIAPTKGSITQFQGWLDDKWYGALGYGARKGFVHLDMRNSKGWRAGGSKGPRWNY